MFKILILTICLFLPLSHAFSKVEVRWFTVASVLLDDGETQILFDPMFTRAGISHWLTVSKLAADEELIKTIIEEQKIQNIKALFASHSHFDHVIDAPIFSKLTGATFYADRSNERIAKAYKSPLIKTSPVESGKSIQVGKFKITPIERDHAAIKGLFEFLPGDVKEDFDFGFYEYRLGQTWCYLVEHPEGKILVDQGSNPHVDKFQKLVTNVDVVIQGIANRKSDEALISGYPKTYKPKVFIPLHFDNFFFGFDRKGYSNLPGVNKEELLDKLKKAEPGMKIVNPVYGERIVLF